MLLRSAEKVTDSVVRATGSVYKRAWRQWFYALSVMLGVWVGQHWGIRGAALGAVGMLAVKFILMTHLGNKSANIRWSGVGRAFLPGLRLAVVVAAVTWGTVAILARWQVESIVVLAIAALANSMVLFLLARLMPRLVLGNEGVWIVETFFGSMPCGSYGQADVSPT